MNIVDLSIIVLIMFFTSFYMKEQFTEVSRVRSSVDNNEYLVRNEKDNKEAANLLAKMNIKLLQLIEVLKKDYPKDERTKRVIKNYDPKALSESDENNKYTSYSVNKGEQIVFCLRMRNANNTLVDENTLTYVAIHELGHLATKEVGHLDVFWNNFKWLLQIATDNGIYNYVDYSKNPQPYCGLVISSNILNN
jgi:predicted metal-dependent hydrolase